MCYRCTDTDRFFSHIRRKKKTEPARGDVTWTQLGLFPPPPRDDASAVSAPATARGRQTSIDSDVFLDSKQPVSILF